MRHKVKRKVIPQVILTTKKQLQKLKKISKEVRANKREDNVKEKVIKNQVESSIFSNKKNTLRMKVKRKVTIYKIGKGILPTIITW